MQNAESDENSSSSDELKIQRTPRIERKSARRIPRWVYAPLVVLGIMSLAPSVFMGVSSFVYFLWSGQLDHPDVQALLVIPFTIAVANWPFLVLYFFTKIKVHNEWPSLTSVRYAMQSSLVAMAIPNCFILPGFAQLASEPPDVRKFGQTLGFLMAGEILILPILGVGGWFFGRWFAPTPKPKIPWRSRS
jgi:hypothetical protein